jgi:hypothetical protein
MIRQLFLLCAVVLSCQLVYGQNPDCQLVLPPNPLTAKGLSTPFRLQPQNAANGPCQQDNPAQASFAQGAVINTDTGAVFVYNPLVITDGTTPFKAPVVPNLPTNYVAALWFGTNANTLRLVSQAGTRAVQDGVCVQGGGNTFSFFGQYSYCNAPAFFAAVSNAIAAKQLVVPALGTAADGKPCSSTRDFFLVDQDESDNVVTNYLVDPATKRIAQDTTANRNVLPGATVLANGSDNRLKSVFYDGALKCAGYAVQDLADPNQKLQALPFNEIQASLFQGNPVARNPIGHAMTLDAAGNPDLNKRNLYSVGVFQAAVNSASQISTKNYCTNMYNVGAPRILSNKSRFQNFASPAPADFNNLFDFLVNRFNAAVGADNLNCVALLNLPSPLANAVANPAAAAAIIPGPPVLDANPAAATAADLGGAVPLACPTTDPNATPAGFVFNGISFAIGAGAVAGLTLITGSVVYAVRRKSTTLADTKRAVTSSF